MFLPRLRSERHDKPEIDLGRDSKRLDSRLSFSSFDMNPISSGRFSILFSFKSKISRFLRSFIERGRSEIEFPAA